ncbi:testis-expressed protein 2-like [Periophthalmus magnuspinnatus]|uniref:testis-expressed protein 2-like n=1 Tax=Periophthalmus magnuspinnatus TaxID=409849 RepID=UPI0024363A42|nr:testis-expressed protein 2-like [Periophthalmus magnuspinnatus]
MEESKLIFSLDSCEEGPIVSFSKDKPQTGSDFTLGMDLTLNQGCTSQAPSLPHSPSSPGSLADMCSTHEPPTTNLVKSSSSDLELKEDSPVKGKPLLSLVKSLSTEISCRVEHDENLSKSDSKLHLYPRKQLIQQKIPEARPEDVELLCENDPLSMGSLSPIESKGSSLIAELEDTRRKFSEAMHDPFSMFSKIIGDESPKQGRSMSTGDPTVSYVPDLKCRKRTDSEHRGVFDTQIGKSNKRSFVKSPITTENHNAVDHNETCSPKVIMQVLEDHSRTRETNVTSRTYYQNMLPGASLPLYWLLPVGLMAYGFLILPLPPYMTGLSVGVACGFLLGLIVVYVFAPRQTTIRRNRRRNITPVYRKQIEESTLEGWMNEMYIYDAETFHPSATHSVYVSLEGSRLQLSLPNTNIRRWASVNETPPEPAAFVHSRVYKLTDCKVSLLPSGLARKRIWNKKYPICIVLAPGEGDRQEEGKEGAEKLVTLYLFGRTGRDKEEWFQHFLSASKPEATNGDWDEGGSNIVCVGETVQDSFEELVDLTGAMKTRTLVDYSTYMVQLINTESYEAIPSPTDKEGPIIYNSTEIPNKDNTCGLEPGAEMGADLGALGSSADGQPHWVNSLVGRIFWDFLREKFWTDQVAHKIQKKLSKIKLPYFMNELKLADLDMGTCLPQVISTSKPSLDRRGLWLQMEVMYTGCLHMTLETKMNLCKLGKDDEIQTESLQESLQFGSKPRLSILADSDEESSSAGSSDEEDVFEPVGPPGEKTTVVGADGSGNSTGRKILRFVDKIAKSKYFQKATENEYIKKKIAEVSNMPLMLSVEVQELSGTLAINIPPPPTDRIWYSFRVPPRLDLHVRPMLGEREVTFIHVTEWIEKKLQCEFQKVFVMPNMDDLYLPLMTSGLESTPVSHHSSVPSSQQSSIESQEYLSE